MLKEDTSAVSKAPYTFHETFTCADTSLIYCIVCSKCEKLYIGLTSNSRRVRFHMHRHTTETKRQVPLYRHFARKSHDFLRDHRIIPLEHCEPDALLEREAFWIRTLHTLLPHCLNSAYGKPFYTYDHSSLSPSLSPTDTSCADSPIISSYQQGILTACLAHHQFIYARHTRQNTTVEPPITDPPRSGHPRYNGYLPC